MQAPNSPRMEAIHFSWYVRGLEYNGLTYGEKQDMKREYQWFLGRFDNWSDQNAFKDHVRANISDNAWDVIRWIF